MIVKDFTITIFLFLQKLNMKKQPYLYLLFFTLFCLVQPWTACNDNPFQQGQRLYEFYCANCHIEDGSGLESLIPPLANADWVKNNQAALACIIKKGMKGEVVVNGKTYNQEMPGNKNLNQYEIANIINYINHAWGNDYGYAKITEVEKALEACPDY